MDKVFCFWTGENAMSEKRKKCFESMQSVFQSQLILITPHILNHYIQDTHPLHKAYEYLSYVHRADYLRAYFMHYYGGGYSDIKFYLEDHLENWMKSFNLIKEDDNLYIIGYQEFEWGVAPAVCQEARNKWYKLIGNGCYVVKPKTVFTREWLFECERVLDLKIEELIKNPARDPQDFKGMLIDRRPSEYPIDRTQILGDIFHKLCWKYNDKIYQGLPRILSNIEYR